MFDCLPVLASVQPALVQCLPKLSAGLVYQAYKAWVTYALLQDCKLCLSDVWSSAAFTSLEDLTHHLWSLGGVKSSEFLLAFKLTSLEHPGNTSVGFTQVLAVRWHWLACSEPFHLPLHLDLVRFPYPAVIVKGDSTTLHLVRELCSVCDLVHACLV
jgi:hypothetical protein